MNYQKTSQLVVLRTVTLARNFRRMAENENEAKMKLITKNLQVWIFDIAIYKVNRRCQESLN